jgi:hypothetical protein
LNSIDVIRKSVAEKAAFLEGLLLTSKSPIFAIYQLNHMDETLRYRFVPYSRLMEQGFSVAHRNYNLVYTAPLADNETLDSLYERFNLRHPIDFYGHSLSVSDVVVMQRNGVTTAYYVDITEFVAVPGFLNDVKYQQ